MGYLILGFLILIFAPWLALLLAGGAVIAGIWSRLTNLGGCTLEEWAAREDAHKAKGVDQ